MNCPHDRLYTDPTQPDESWCLRCFNTVFTGVPFEGPVIRGRGTPVVSGKKCVKCKSPIGATNKSGRCTTCYHGYRQYGQLVAVKNL